MNTWQKRGPACDMQPRVGRLETSSTANIKGTEYYPQHKTDACCPSSSPTSRKQLPVLPKTPSRTGPMPTPAPPSLFRAPDAVDSKRRPSTSRRGRPPNHSLPFSDLDDLGGEQRLRDSGEA